MTHPSVEEVAGLGLFASLRAEEHAALAAMAVRESFPAGSTVFAEGDPPGDLYFVLEGRVTLCQRVTGRADTCFLSLRHGELLGWSALLRRPRVATARVVVASELLRFPASDLLELCERDPAVGYCVMRHAFEELADRLSDTRLQLLDMFGRPA